jgi:ATP-dependent DNA helicase RecG
LLIADLAKDGRILQESRVAAMEIIEKDPGLKLPEHENIARHIRSLPASAINWSRIS